MKLSNLMKDIVGVLDYVGGFTMVAKALAVSGLAKTLQGKGPYTLFAPTDSAFAKLGTEEIDALFSDRARLAATLSYHVLPERLTVTTVLRKGGSSLPSIVGRPPRITIHDGKVFVDDAMVVRADIAGSNGVIHGIDAVLMPRTTLLSVPQ